MNEEIEFLRSRIIHYRRLLNDLEARRTQYAHGVPQEIWNQLTDVSRRLDQAERRLSQINTEQVAQINRLRMEIIKSLEEYNHWREQMREVDQLFLTNIIRPGYRLQQAILQREYLEGEYKRIRLGIEYESYTSLVELEADIRSVLTHGDAAFEADEEKFKDEALREKEILERVKDLGVDGRVDEFKKEQLVREFKRIVLPAVHPDTSDTEESIFKTVFEVYEKRDYLLMGAYTAQYRGEIEMDPEADALEFLELASQYQDEYTVLKTRLVRRVEHLKRDLTPEELEDPERVQESMRQQRWEIQERIQQEAEQIIELRNKLEGLSSHYLERKEKGGNPK